MVRFFGQTRTDWQWRSVLWTKLFGTQKVTGLMSLPNTKTKLFQEIIAHSQQQRRLKDMTWHCSFSRNDLTDVLLETMPDCLRSCFIEDAIPWMTQQFHEIKVGSLLRLKTTQYFIVEQHSLHCLHHHCSGLLLLERWLHNNGPCSQHNSLTTCCSCHLILWRLQAGMTMSTVIIKLEKSDCFDYNICINQTNTPLWVWMWS